MSASNSSFDIDIILNELGSFGKYQVVNIFLICITLFLLTGDGWSYVFTTADIDYRCKVPECESENATYNADVNFLNFTIPHDGKSWSKCNRYEVLNSTLIESDICDSDQFNQDKEIACNEFIYTTEETMIISEWDLNCKNEWRLTLVGTLYEAGGFIGLPISGLVSDRYGRRTVYVIGTMLCFIFGIMQSFSVSYIMYVILELSKSVAGSGVFVASFVLIMELVGPKHRILGGVFINIFYALGQAYFGVLAYFFRTWRNLLLVIYCPSIIFFFYFWILPESIRWLVTKSHFKKAANYIERIAKMNKITLSENVINMLKSTEIKYEQFKDDETKTNETEVSKNNSSFKLILGALKSRKILLRLLNCSFCWIANVFIYYGLNIYSISVAGDKYINFILVCLIEIPATIMWYLTERIGRKRTQSGSLIISGVACLVALFLSDDTPFGYELAFFLFSKFAITISFNTLYVYTAEIFPTEVRNILFVICSSLGRVGSFAAPQIPLMAKYMESLPMIMFASLALLSGLLVLLLPETINKNLPDTIKEAENL